MKIQWPCLLKECVDPDWHACDSCVQFWTDAKSTHPCETLTFSEFTQYVDELTELFRDIWSIQYSTTTPHPLYPLVGIVWGPHILSSVTVHAVVKANAAFYPVTLETISNLTFFSNQLIAVVCLHAFNDITLPHGFVRYIPKAKISRLFDRNDWCLFLREPVEWVPMSIAFGLSENTIPNTHLAYVISTSGSSGGAEKLVFVADSCLTANIVDLNNRFPSTDKLVARSSVLLTAPLTFDPSLVQIYFALSTRRCLIVLDRGVLLQSGTSLTSLCINASVDWLQCTPGLLLSQSLEERSRLLSNPQLTVILGGEPFPWDLAFAARRARLFGIYGVTEVSSWATFFTFKSSHPPDEHAAISCDCHPPVVGSTPIGFPMMSTEIVITQRNGSFGELGLSRKLGGVVVYFKKGSSISNSEFGAILEQLPTSRTWFTGDLVLRGHCGECLWFAGRSNRVLKRFGHQICLDRLERAIEQCRIPHTSVRFCKCAYYYGTSNRGLHALVGIEQKPTGNHSGRTLLCRHRRRLRSDIFRLIKKHFHPNYQAWIPSRIVFTQYTTYSSPHGKLLFTPYSRLKHERLQRAEIANIWNEIIGNPRPNVVPPDETFFQNGGSSLSAFLLLESLIDAYPVLKHHRQRLLSLIFSATFQVLMRFITVHSRHCFQGSPKRHLRPFPLDEHPTVTNIHQDVGIESTLNRQRMPAVSYRGTTCHISIDVSKPMVLEPVWQYYLGKCIDASALVVSNDRFGGDSPTVFIGSHSGKFVSLKLLTGDSCWDSQAPIGLHGRRIEASAIFANLSSDLVAVGTLDGCLIAMDPLCGMVIDTFHLGGAIKSESAVFQEMNLLVSGSHGRIVSGFDIRAGKRPVLENHFDNTPITAPICVSNPTDNQHQTSLLIGSLGGTIGCLDPRKPNQLIWKQTGLAPIFAKPILYPNYDTLPCVMVATAVGSLSAFSLADGKPIWNKEPRENESIFSNPVLVPQTSTVVISSSCGHITGVNFLTGQEEWDVNCVVDLAEQQPCLLGTPCLLYSPDASAVRRPSMLVNRADGALMQCSVSRAAVATRLPAHCFSSPVVFASTDDSYCVVGCRDDYVHCFRLASLASDRD